MIEQHRRQNLANQKLHLRMRLPATEALASLALNQQRKNQHQKPFDVNSLLYTITEATAALEGVLSPSNSHASVVDDLFPRIEWICDDDDEPASKKQSLRGESHRTHARKRRLPGLVRSKPLFCLPSVIDEPYIVSDDDEGDEKVDMGAHCLSVVSNKKRKVSTLALPSLPLLVLPVASFALREENHHQHHHAYTTKTGPPRFQQLSISQRSMDQESVVSATCTKPHAPAFFHTSNDQELSSYSENFPSLLLPDCPFPPCP